MYRVVVADMPTTVPAYSMHDDAEDYTTIVVNSRMNIERQRKSYKHEIEHIENDDFHSGKSADEIECERH